MLLCGPVGSDPSVSEDAPFQLMASVLRDQDSSQSFLYLRIERLN